MQVNGLDRSWQRPPGLAAKLIDSKARNGYVSLTLTSLCFSHLGIPLSWIYFSWNLFFSIIRVLLLRVHAAESR